MRCLCWCTTAGTCWPISQASRGGFRPRGGKLDGGPRHADRYRFVASISSAAREAIGGVLDACRSAFLKADASATLARSPARRSLDTLPAPDMAHGKAEGVHSSRSATQGSGPPSLGCSTIGTSLRRKQRGSNRRSTGVHTHLHRRSAGRRRVAKQTLNLVQVRLAQCLTARQQQGKDVRWQFVGLEWSPALWLRAEGSRWSG